MLESKKEVKSPPEGPKIEDTELIREKIREEKSHQFAGREQVAKLIRWSRNIFAGRETSLLVAKLAKYPASVFLFYFLISNGLVF